MAISIAAAGGAGDDSEGRIHGRIDAAQACLLTMGRMKFGPPLPEIENRIRSIQDLKQLEELLYRLLEAASWQELFPSE